MSNDKSNYKKCSMCNEVKELAYYKNELICMNCAKDEMLKDGSAQREILKHGEKHD